MPPRTPEEIKRLLNEKVVEYNTLDHMLIDLNTKIAAVNATSITDNMYDDMHGMFTEPTGNSKGHTKSKEEKKAEEAEKAAVRNQKKAILTRYGQNLHDQIESFFKGPEGYDDASVAEWVLENYVAVRLFTSSDFIVNSTINSLGDAEGRIHEAAKMAKLFLLKYLPEDSTLFWGSDRHVPETEENYNRFMPDNFEKLPGRRENYINLRGPLSKVKKDIRSAVKGVKKNPVKPQAKVKPQLIKKTDKVLAQPEPVIQQPDPEPEAQPPEVFEINMDLPVMDEIKDKQPEPEVKPEPAKAGQPQNNEPDPAVEVKNAVQAGKDALAEYKVEPEFKERIKELFDGYELTPREELLFKFYEKNAANGSEAATQVRKWLSDACELKKDGMEYAAHKDRIQEGIHYIKVESVKFLELQAAECDEYIQKECSSDQAAFLKHWPDAQSMANIYRTVFEGTSSSAIKPENAEHIRSILKNESVLNEKMAAITASAASVSAKQPEVGQSVPVVEQPEVKQPVPVFKQPVEEQPDPQREEVKVEQPVVEQSEVKQPVPVFKQPVEEQPDPQREEVKVEQPDVKQPVPVFKQSEVKQPVPVFKQPVEEQPDPQREEVKVEQPEVKKPKVGQPASAANQQPVPAAKAQPAAQNAEVPNFYERDRYKLRDFKDSLERAMTGTNSGEYKAIINTISSMNKKENGPWGDKMTPAENHAAKLVSIKKCIDDYITHKGREGVKRNTFKKLSAVEQLNEFVCSTLRELNVNNIPDKKINDLYNDIRRTTLNEEVPVTYKNKLTIRENVNFATLFEISCSEEGTYNTLKCMDRIIKHAPQNKVDELRAMQSEWYKHPGSEVSPAHELAFNALLNGSKQKTRLSGRDRKDYDQLLTAGGYNSPLTDEEDAALCYAQKHKPDITMTVTKNGFGYDEDLTWDEAKKWLDNSITKTRGNNTLIKVSKEGELEYWQDKLQGNITSIKASVIEHLKGNAGEKLEYMNSIENDKDLIEKWPKISREIAPYGEFFEAGNSTSGQVVAKYESLKTKMVALAEPHANKIKSDKLEKYKEQEKQKNNQKNL